MRVISGLRRDPGTGYPWARRRPGRPQSYRRHAADSVARRVRFTPTAAGRSGRIHYWTACPGTKPTRPAHFAEHGSRDQKRPGPGKAGQSKQRSGGSESGWPHRSRRSDTHAARNPSAEIAATPDRASHPLSARYQREIIIMKALTYRGSDGVCMKVVERMFIIAQCPPWKIRTPW